MKTLTVFAGPNGSGKTTITDRLKEDPPFELGQYLNPDEIEQQLIFQEIVVIDGYGIRPTRTDWEAFLNQSTLAEKICRDNKIS